MVSIKVDKTRLLKKISKFKAALEQEVSKGLTEIASKGATQARTGIRGRGQNGLWANTQAYMKSPLDQGILAHKFYASWVEFGNGPPGSRIYPKNKKCLHFKINGQDVFAKSVAASRPRPFMSKALDFITENATTIMSKHIYRIIHICFD